MLITRNKHHKFVGFVRKGKHEDCMKDIPIDGSSEGPHDCTFDTKFVPCGCQALGN